MTAITKLVTVLLTVAGITVATPATAAADPTDDGYDNIFGLITPESSGRSLPMGTPTA